MSLVLVSILMPSFNQRHFIEMAINSILEQSYSKIEIVIADGGSTDGTVEFLTELGQQDSRVRWFSEADSGPAQALNRALKRARGTVIGWLNSDDLYTDDAIERAVGFFNQHPNYLMVYGHGEHINVDGQIIDIYPTLLPETPYTQFSEGCFICQPTVFFRRPMALLVGNFNETFKTAFDFDYWMRVFNLIPTRIGFIDAVQAQSRLHDNCITLRMRETVITEGMRILFQHLGYAPKEWFLTYVNELLEQSKAIDDSDVIKIKIFDVFDDVKKYISEDDLKILKRELDLLLCG
jgi:glycosyltransferase involved in cell wall biosynthesis